MAVIKLVEPFGVSYLRSQVRDSLQYHGEEAILLSLYHVSRDNHTEVLDRCPRCSSGVYLDGEEMCPVCYGTNFFNNETQTGGVKDARRAWCQFSDHVVSESYGQRGVMAPDTREVQCEPFPLLMEHDVIVRVKSWAQTSVSDFPLAFPDAFGSGPTQHVPQDEGQFYSINAVTRNSLRTGNQFGQTTEDVIGQKAQCSWLPPNSNGIQLFPIMGVPFPAAAVQATPVLNLAVEPDTKVVFYPIAAQAPFTFTQNIPSTVWTINHALGHLPEVTIIVGGELVDADVDYPSLNQVIITFAVPQVGSAELV